MFTLAATIIQPIALTVTLVYVIGLIGNRSLTDLQMEVVFGVLFTVGVIASMLTPVVLSEGTIVDIRNLLVGAAMALLGPIAGAVALVGGSATRLLIGGQSALIGVIAMGVAAVAGLFWRYQVKPRIISNNLSYLALGFLISSHLPVGLFLDDPVRTRFFMDVAPVLLILNLVGALLLGAMLEREKLRLSEVEELREAAGTDPLTSLLNRRRLSDSADQLTTDHTGETGRVVLCFDIDNFKDINDLHGHKIGDLVLKTVSERIQTSLRPDDLFSRLGGDEFAVVLPSVTQTVGKMVANRCCKLIADEPVETPRGPIVVTISLGGNWSNVDEDLEVMLDRADAALYQAKRQGRNRAMMETSQQPELPKAS